MSFYRVGNVGVLYSPEGPMSVEFSPAVAPLPLETKLVVTGHSIPDGAINGILSPALTAMGGTPDLYTSTGPLGPAEFRWVNDPAAPVAVRALMEAPEASYDAFLGIEAYGGSYEEGRSSVREHVTWSNAHGYAVQWHNLAHSAGCTRSYYGNFWRDAIPTGAPVFDAGWRAAQNLEKPYWDALIDYVNANKAVGSPTMQLVPWLEVFCAIYDAIQAGTVTGITMGSLFGDNVHPSAGAGRWVLMATLIAVVYQRHPDTVPLASSANATIDSGLAAQLRPIIWSTCLSTARTGLGA